jgi:signal peptidase II
MDHPAPSRPSSSTRSLWLFWGLTVFILISDLLSKHLIFQALAQNPTKAFTNLPWIMPAVNKGVAFSLGSDYPLFIPVMTLVLVPGIFVWFWWKLRPQADWIVHLCFGLIMGGAIGNAYDRSLVLFNLSSRFQGFVDWNYGSPGVGPGVRDFLHFDLGFWPFHPWPTFNIADSGLTVGITILVLHTLFVRPPKSSGNR